MDWTLHRLYLADATVGVLECDEHRFLVLEDTMKGGGFAPDSCVPTGSYLLEPHSGPKYQDTFALVGEHVAHWPTPGKPRSAVLVHVGNDTGDTSGCLLLGKSFTFAPQPAVFNSRVAVAEWLALMRANEGPHRLRITG